MYNIGGHRLVGLRRDSYLVVAGLLYRRVGIPLIIVISNVYDIWLL